MPPFDHWHRAFGRMILLVACLAMTPGSALADQLGTITLRSGEVFENVAFTVDQQIQILRIDLATGTRRVLFGDVERIETADGDITATIIPPRTGRTSSRGADGGGAGYEGAGGSPWEAPDGSEVSEAREKPFAVALSTTGNGGIFFGDFYDGLGPGPGIGAAVLIPVQHDAAIHFMAERTWAETENFPVTGTDPNTGDSITLDFEYSETTFTVGAGWLATEEGSDRPIPGFAYVHGGLGLANHHVCATATGPDGNGGRITVEECDTETDLVLAFGAGGMIPVMDSVFVDGGLTLFATYVDAYTAEGVETNKPAYFLRGRIGLAFVF